MHHIFSPGNLKNLHTHTVVFSYSWPTLSPNDIFKGTITLHVFPAKICSVSHWLQTTCIVQPMNSSNRQLIRLCCHHQKFRKERFISLKDVFSINLSLHFLLAAQQEGLRYDEKMQVKESWMQLRDQTCTHTVCCQTLVQTSLCFSMCYFEAETPEIHNLRRDVKEFNYL